MAKESAKDQVKGTAHEVKGKVKEKVGRLLNDVDMEAEGHLNGGEWFW